MRVFRLLAHAEVWVPISTFQCQLQWPARAVVVAKRRRTPRDGRTPREQQLAHGYGYVDSPGLFQDVPRQVPDLVIGQPLGKRALPLGLATCERTSESGSASATRARASIGTPPTRYIQEQEMRTLSKPGHRAAAAVYDVVELVGAVQAVLLEIGQGQRGVAFDNVPAARVAPSAAVLEGLDGLFRGSEGRVHGEEERQRQRQRQAEGAASERSSVSPAAGKGHGRSRRSRRSRRPLAPPCIGRVWARLCPAGLGCRDEAHCIPRSRARLPENHFQFASFALPNNTQRTKRASEERHACGSLGERRGDDGGGDGESSGSCVAVHPSPFQCPATSSSGLEGRFAVARGQAREQPGRGGSVSVFGVVR